MESRLYVSSLSKSTTEEELNTLLAQAGKVTSVEVIKERNCGEPEGFAFVTMTMPGEAEKAVQMFNVYSLGGHTSKVDLAKPREHRGAAGPIFDPPKLD